MNKLKLTLASLATTLMLSSCISCNDTSNHTYELLKVTRDSVFYQKRHIKQLKEIISAYDKYYHSAEILMDSIDSPSFGTDVEATYLRDRENLNNLVNQLESNPNHRH